MNTLIIGVETKGAKEAATELDHLAKSGEKAEKKTKGVGKGAGQTVAPFKSMRGATQQASFQLQDIAVQAQSGTDAFIILGQQGPQLASIFGPGGAVFGALIAFGALFGGLLFKSMNASGDAAKDLADRMDNLADGFDSATRAQKAFLRAQAEKNINERKEEIKSLQAELKKLSNFKFDISELFGSEKTYKERVDATNELLAKIDELNIMNEETAASVDSTSNETQAYIEKLTEEADILGLNAKQLAQYRIDQLGAVGADAAAIHEKSRLIFLYNEEQEAIKVAADTKKKLDAQKVKDDADALKASERAEAAADKLENNLAKFIARENVKRDAKKLAAQENLAVIEQSLMSERELVAAYAAEDLARITADRDANLISLQEFNIAKGQIEQDAANQRVAITKTEEEQKAAIKEQLSNMVIGQAASVAGQLTSMAKQAYGEESAAYKAAFLVQQGIAIASAIMSTQVAAAAALAPPPIGLGPIAGLGMAGTIQAMGAANVGIIAGQTIAGLARANGGQVRGGESYLVGERGPELLTMGTSGRIATNENLKSAMNSDQGKTTQNVNVNFSIVANDTKGFDQLLNSRRGQIVSMINRAVNNSGKATLT